DYHCQSYDSNLSAVLF
nr:immunoglobulin light chain junction region [Macaca mulatta]MOV73453.1 immunoglobulin light chain junction region [Macaca mulatta]